MKYWIRIYPEDLAGIAALLPPRARSNASVCQARALCVERDRIGPKPHAINTLTCAAGAAIAEPVKTSKHRRWGDPQRPCCDLDPHTPFAPVYTLDAPVLLNGSAADDPESRPAVFHKKPKPGTESRLN